MKHRLLDHLTALSLLLCAAVVALWVRSLWHADEVVFRPSDDLTVWSFASADREVVFTSIRHKGYTRKRTADDFRYTHSPAGGVRGLHRRIRDLHQGRRLGVGWTLPGPRDNPAMTWVTVPHAIVGAVPSVLPAVRCVGWLCRRVRDGRRKGGCPTCGYDLTGNVSGVCPECGAAKPGRPA